MEQTQEQMSDKIKALELAVGPLPQALERIEQLFQRMDRAERVMKDVQALAKGAAAPEQLVRKAAQTELLQKDYSEVLAICVEAGVSPHVAGVSIVRAVLALAEELTAEREETQRLREEIGVLRKANLKTGATARVHVDQLTSDEALLADSEGVLKHKDGQATVPASWLARVRSGDSA